MVDKPEIFKVTQIVPEAFNLEEIDSGGFKVVYKATVKGKTEAVKLVQIPNDDDNEDVRDENLRRIVREIEILKNATSPYLVKLGSIEPRPCNIDDKEYVVYSEEFLDGESLRQIIKSGYFPKKDELVELAICLLEAVRELSGLNVIHRDIKPNNVISTNDPGRPYVLLDLGIAFHIGGTQLTSAHPETKRRH